MMTYKGYGCAIRFDDEAEFFHGDVSGLRDVVTFQGKTVAELRKAFRDSVDDYLDFAQSVARLRTSRFRADSFCGSIPRFTAVWWN